MASPLRPLLDQLLIIPDQTSRAALEEKIRSLQHEMQDFAVHLVVLLTDEGSGPIQLRQLAAVLLKQYIDDHWDAPSAPPAPTSQAKGYIRSSLCGALGERTGKIRGSVAYALSRIGKKEWPDTWPDLFVFLVQATNSPDPNLLHGSMKLLSELVDIVEASQLDSFTPVLFARLLDIIEGYQTFNVRMRTRAVNIFSSLCSVMTDKYDPGGHNDISKKLLLPWLQRYGKVLTECLSVPDGQFSDVGLKTAILTCCNVLLSEYPSQLVRWFGQKMLHTALHLLEVCAEAHVRTCAGDAEGEEEDLVDSDGNVLGVEQMVYQLCELLQRLSTESGLNNDLEPELMRIFYAILCFMQLSDDKVDEWIENVDLFVEEEDEENCPDSLRVASKDLLLSVCDDHGESSIPGFCGALKRHLGEAAIKQNAGREDWWKGVEGGITALGSVIDYLMSNAERLQKELNMIELIAEHVFPSLESQSTAPENAFLRGQAVWFLSRIVDSLVLDWQKKLVEVCVLFMEKEQPRIIQVSGARALYNICEYANGANKFDLIEEHMDKIISGFVNLATSGTETIVNLALNSLASCSSASPSSVAKFERRVGPLVMACTLKYSGDPLIPSQTCEIVKRLASVQGCRQKLEDRIIPMTLSILEANNPQNLPMQLPAVSLDLILALMKGCGPPLSDKMLNRAFPTVVHYVLRSEDIDALASGRECIRGFVTLAPEEIVRWEDGAGNTGLTMIIQVICHFLKPETPELPATMVCRLVYAVLRVAGREVRPHLERILGAVVSKMALTQIHRVRKSLVVICAYFFNFETESVVEFLSGLACPSPSLGRNALEFVVLEWCDYHGKFLSMHDRKVSIMGLCHVLDYGVKKNPLPFKDIVTGVEKEEILVHIFRLLVKDRADVDSENQRTAGGMMNGAKDSGAGASGNINDILAELSHDLEEAVSSDENADPDQDTDYLRQLDLKEYLTGYLGGFKNNNHYYGSFLERVGKEEWGWLNKWHLI